MGKKPFIDKKTARHYEIVHRSQRDPLLADENASKFVLKQTCPSLNLLKKGKYELNPEDDQFGYNEDFLEDNDNYYDYESYDGEMSESEIFDVESDTEEKEPLKNVKGEVVEREAGVAVLYGVDFDDTEYDYMQHLKVMGEDPTAVFIPSKEEQKAAAKKKGIQFIDESIDIDDVKPVQTQRKRVTFQLPDEALPSKYEEDVGLMNREDSDILTVDPNVREVLYSLDDPNTIDENMEDDFILKLNAELGSDEEDVDIFGQNEESSDDDDDEWAAVRKFQKEQKKEKANDELSDDWVERRSATTGFSMSSSAMFRNKHLTLLDDRFERIINQYDDDNIGELDPEAPNVRGNIEDSDLPKHYDNLFDEFLDDKDVLGKKVIEKFAGGVPEDQIKELRDELKVEGFDLVKYEEQQRTKKESTQMVERELSKLEKREKNNWDCETVLTTYSNIYNHPKVIKETNTKKIHVTRKGLPIVIPEENEEENEEDEDEEEYVERENLGKARKKKETSEEKKARKEMVKNAKKERRAMKKATKNAFKKERMKQEHIVKVKSDQERTMKIE